ncbi:RDD family protein [Terrabacter carboxydivorans]|uniref:RDD domain-containing protein n=1 Tax=Terrabacter carboxydivorans TaxID=619730 RepID=A0ABN3M403_9MICO
MTSPSPGRGPVSRIVLPGPARSVQGHRAGIVTRATAGAVDLVVAFAAVGVGYAVWSGAVFVLGPASFRFPDPGGLRLLLCVLGVLTAYLTAAWATTGRTVGNRLLGLRVVGDGTGGVGFVRALLRALLCVAFPVLLFWVLVSAENRSLPDVLLRTSVVYDWTSAGRRGPEPTTTPPPIVLPHDE